MHIASRSPADILAAYQATPVAERAAFVSAAVTPMATTLQDSDRVTALAHVDVDAFETGLRAALRVNPANITALRSLVSLFNRLARFAEAEEVIAQGIVHWSDHAEFPLERLRMLIVQNSPRRYEAFEAGVPFYKNLIQHQFYESQVRFDPANGLPNAVELDRMTKIGKATFADMLAGEGTPAQSRIHRTERAIFRRICELIVEADRVALVGNGPSLIDAGHGGEIDGHDLVIRCNFPELQDREADIGERTDLVVFNESLRNSIKAMRLRSPHYESVLALGVHPDRNRGLPPKGTPQGDIVAPILDNLATLPPVGRAFLSDAFYPRATTGVMTALLLALVFQRQVSLFGFDFFDDANRPHYFGNQIGAYLGHELAYEKWFAQGFLGSIAPGRIVLR
jgi:hypothetical protein